MQNKPITFQFISEPSDVNYGGNVHGGSVMKWIDQAGYACATTWSGNYSVTVYVGGIRFYDPIKIGEVVKVDAQVIYTGTSSMHIAINVFSRNLKQPNFEKKPIVSLFLLLWMKMVKNSQYLSGLRKQRKKSSLKCMPNA
ncbi:hypothetical protein OWR28_21430 [Chryseobacterium sp. 1B4]